MKSIFDETAYNELLERIDNLNENSDRKWGKMDVGQMAWHCQFPLKMAVENKDHGKKGNVLIQWFFKKSLYSDKPLRKNLPTSPQLKAREEKNFEKEREVLRELTKATYEVRDRQQWNPHPLFGTFTPEQWGMMQYKHLDHHLTQFGV